MSIGRFIERSDTLSKMQKSRLFVKLANLTKHYKHERCTMYIAGDIVVELHVLVDASGEYIASIPVTPNMLFDSGEPYSEDIFRFAIHNTGAMFRPMFVPIPDSWEKYEAFDVYDPEIEEHFGLSALHDVLCITNEKTTCGASSVFVPGVLDRACDLLADSTVCIAFTSADEAIVQSSKADVDMISKIVTDVDSELGPQAISHLVYRYDRTTKQIYAIGHESHKFLLG